MTESFDNAALRDAIASAVVSARHGRLDDVADAILAMPEMQAIKAILREVYEMDFGKYWNTAVREWVLS